MSNVTPPGPAGALRLTVKLKTVPPALASFRETSLIVRLVGAAHDCADVAELRGLGAAAEKSVLFSFVSVQPLLARSTAVVVLGAGVFAVPSRQFAVAP